MVTYQLGHYEISFSSELAKEVNVSSNRLFLPGLALFIEQTSSGSLTLRSVGLVSYELKGYHLFISFEESFEEEQ